MKEHAESKGVQHPGNRAGESEMMKSWKLNQVIRESKCLHDRRLTSQHANDGTDCKQNNEYPEQQLGGAGETACDPAESKYGEQD
jgi:hypothetical protein